MRISLNWLNEYLRIPVDKDELSRILTDIGLEVEGMEEIESIKGGLAGLVIAKVVECGQHPNADKLSLTKVDLGGEELTQIVCGAPNVAAGQKVVVATIGTTLYTAEGEAWKIKKGKIRGEVSEGMICAEDEIGLGASHDGIMVLPDDIAIGTLAKDYFEIENDVVYDIGLTPNRSDATSHIGVVKDLLAYFRTNGYADIQACFPNVDKFKVDSNEHPIEVVVETIEGCPRFAGVTISGIKIGESPSWLKNRLASIGVRPISNIVDITNFVLHEIGQPLHAYDASKISGNKIIVQTLADGTVFKSLDEIDRKLSSKDLIVCDGESKGMCIAGVFGGIDSGVTDDTDTIFLESAHFNAKWIRTTSTSHLLRTDAAMRFEKGSDPNIAIYALKRAALLIQEIAGGKIISEIVDEYPNPIEPTEIEVKYSAVNKLIGVEIPKEKVHEILEAMEMEITSKGESFVAKVPTNKADVTRPADIIEEILRIYGFNTVPFGSTIRSTIVHGDVLEPYKLRNTLATFMVGKGFYETMNLSIIPSKHYKENLSVYEDKMVYINNTSNIHLDIMRPEMLMSSLLTCAYNQNRQQQSVKFYEFGRSYQKTEEITEQEHLVLTLTGNQENASWLNREGIRSDYFTLKREVFAILDRLNLANSQNEELTEDDRFDYGMRYFRGKDELVRFGLVNEDLSEKMGVKGEVYCADFNFDNLLKTQKNQKLRVAAINKFPSTKRDLALVIDSAVTFDQIKRIAHKTDKKWLKEISLFDVYKSEKHLGKDKKSYAISFTIEDNTKTLKDKEVDKLMKKLIMNFEKEVGAKIRS